MIYRTEYIAHLASESKQASNWKPPGGPQLRLVQYTELGLEQLKGLKSSLEEQKMPRETLHEKVNYILEKLTTLSVYHSRSLDYE